MIEVLVRVVTIDGKQGAFVDRIDRENKQFETLDKNGEWQQSKLYTPQPEMMHEVRVL